MITIQYCKIVYTIGYDARPIKSFIEILRYYNVKRVIDVRRWAKSLKNPDYRGEVLEKHLLENGIDYYWLPDLGGYRKFGVDVEDRGVANCFKSQGFRAYATYIAYSPKPKKSLELLVKLVSEKPSAIMCAEKYPWMCHRKILADYLVVKGFRVIHIIDIDQIVEHKLHSCAMNINGELHYV